MGGEIGMDSTLGEGTKVWFHVRLGAVDGPPAADTEPLPEIPPLRVLVVDDVEINQGQDLTDFLRDHPSGSEVEITIVRDARFLVTLNATLVDQPES